jgi:hypothetical protein
MQMQLLALSGKKVCNNAKSQWRKISSARKKSTQALSGFFALAHLSRDK